MRRVVKLVLGGGVAVVGVVGLAAVAGYAWISSASAARLAQTFTVHDVSIPVPFPLTDEEIDELRAQRLASLAEEGSDDLENTDVLAGVDLGALAMERAIARGKYLVDARYACSECHGENFGGGTMVDDPVVGRLLGPNLTGGEGSVVKNYTISDWDRIVRHGVKPNGRPAVMPSMDFFAMSDEELSDIVAYIQSHPAVDHEVPPVTLGPLFMGLLALDQVPLSAATHPGHDREHVARPPSFDDTIAYGGHVAQVCTGCHRSDFTGGKVAGGPPDWPPASNLTPHEAGLAGWTEAEFADVLRTGKRRDGTALREPMNELAAMATKMEDRDIHAMFAFLQSLPPKEGE
jgi:mono/diheme cytochrome c family protein